MTPAPAPLPQLKLRVVFDDQRMLGPGKIALLARIRDTGSISAAGRQMGMSYKRAWMLVEVMNAMFTAPLVSSARGGAGGGGASLTAEGEAVLALYTRLAEAATTAGQAEIAALMRLLRD